MHLPLPIADTDRPWENSCCDTCKGFCAGHYKVKYVDVRENSAIASCMSPPSTVLKKEFSKLKEYPPSDQYLRSIAAKVLLNPDVVRMWLDHLHTVLQNRRRVKKAAAIRQAEKLALAAERPATTATSYYCGLCSKEYKEESDHEELWIGCYMCDKWYCGSCEGLKSAPAIDIYICTACRQ